MNGLMIYLALGAAVSALAFWLTRDTTEGLEHVRPLAWLIGALIWPLLALLMVSDFLRSLGKPTS